MKKRVGLAPQDIEERMASISVVDSFDNEITPLITTHASLTNFQAYMSILKAFVGAAILAMPFAYRTSGLFGASMALLLVGVTVDLTMKYLVQIKKKIHELRRERGGQMTDVNYPEMAFEVSGVYAHHFIAVSLLVAQVGACCAYHIFIARSIEGMFDEMAAQKETGQIYTYLPLALAPLLLFLCLLAHGNPKHLAPVALAGNVFELCTLVAVTIYAFVSNCVGASTACGSEINLFDLGSIPITLGIVAFAMEGIFPVLPIEHSMKDPDSFNVILDYGILTAATLCALFGLAGYYIFGVDTAAVLTLNVTGGVGKAVKVGLSLALFATYPIQLYPVLQWSDQIVDDRLGLENPKLKLAKRSVVVLSVASTTIFATVFPHFGNALSLVGCVGFAIGGLIAPPVFYLKMFPAASLRDKLVLGFIFVFGVFTLVIGTYANIVDVAKGNGE